MVPLVSIQIFFLVIVRIHDNKLIHTCNIYPCIRISSHDICVVNKQNKLICSHRSTKKLTIEKQSRTATVRELNKYKKSLLHTLQLVPLHVSLNKNPLSRHTHRQIDKSSLHEQVISKRKTNKNKPEIKKQYSTTSIYLLN